MVKTKIVVPGNARQFLLYAVFVS